MVLARMNFGTFCSAKAATAAANLLAGLEHTLQCRTTFPHPPRRSQTQAGHPCRQSQLTNFTRKKIASKSPAPACSRPSSQCVEKAGLGSTPDFPYGCQEVAGMSQACCKLV